MPKILVTGASGCIGAWVVKQLIDEGATVTALDKGPDRHRLESIIDAEDLERVRFITGDVADLDGVRTAVERHGTDGVIHLAGMQVPSCKANPVLGAQVNVLGTLAILEAAAEVLALHCLWLPPVLAPLIYGVPDALGGGEYKPWQRLVAAPGHRRLE